MSVDWAVYYDMLPNNFFCFLYLFLNTFFIIVEEEAGDIELTRMLEVRFEIDHCMLDRPHMPVPEVLALGAPSASRQYPSLAPSHN